MVLISARMRTKGNATVRARLGLLQRQDRESRISRIKTGASMKIIFSLRLHQILFLGLAIMTTAAFSASSIYDFTLPSIDGQPMPLSNFKGKVVLLVNVAS